MTGEYIQALLGGAIIGVASVLMLLFNGKILGISGILGGMLQRSSGGKGWRYSFLFGILVGGMLLRVLHPQAFEMTLSRSPLALVGAGLLVGYGTRYGSGCTSGHGVCGVSRLSPRSLVATLTFMATGALVVLVVNRVFGGAL